VTGIKALSFNKAGWTIACHKWEYENPKLEDGYDPTKRHFEYWIEPNGSLVNSPYQNRTEYDVACAFLRDIMDEEWEVIE
jgi:hypothetical protein